MGAVRSTPVSIVLIAAGVFVSTGWLSQAAQRDAGDEPRTREPNRQRQTTEPVNREAPSTQIAKPTGDIPPPAPPRGNRRPNRPANAAPPAVFGQVVAYTPGELLRVDVKRRGGTSEVREFKLPKDQTKIEFPEGTPSLKVGSTVSVWVDGANSDQASRVVVNGAAARQQGMRRPQTVQPGMAMSAPNRAMNEEPDQLAMLTSILPKAIKPPVAGLKPDEVAKQIDRYIAAQLAAENIPASPACDDAEWLRRAYLDITGVIPPPQEITAFLESTDPDKRARWIDQLLNSAEYGRHFADLWCDRIALKDTPIYREPFIAWMAESLNRGRGWNELVFEMLTVDGKFGLLTRGSRLRPEDPRGLLMVLNTEGGAPAPKPNPALLAAETGRLFLGVQIQCAECHDHPFSSTWKQTDFWGLAAFFGRFNAAGANPGFRWMESPVASATDTKITIPLTSLKNVGQIVPARLLSKAQEYRAADAELLRHSLARWITAPENPFFAQAAVNRLWADFFGRGLVNPVNDLRPDNPPSHPEILTLLADEFVKSEFDFKHLIRVICLTQAYQRTSRSLAANERDTDKYSHMPVRVLGPGVFYDCLVKATGFADLKLGLPERKTKLTVATLFTPREVFVDFYRAAQGEEADPLENSHGIPQALKLMNAVQLNGVAPVVQRLSEAGAKREQVIEQLYLATLSRRPAPEELQLASEFLSGRDSADLLQGYAAIHWALINCAEFLSNH